MLYYGFGLSSLGKFLPAGVTTYMDGVVSEKKNFSMGPAAASLWNLTLQSSVGTSLIPLVGLWAPATNQISA